MLGLLQQFERWGGLYWGKKKKQTRVARCACAICVCDLSLCLFPSWQKRLLFWRGKERLRSQSWRVLFGDSERLVSQPPAPHLTCKNALTFRWYDSKTVCPPCPVFSTQPHVDETMTMYINGSFLTFFFSLNAAYWIPVKFNTAE